MKYRKKPVVIDAVQWKQYGDHEAVRVFNFERSGDHPMAATTCLRCGLEMHMKLGHAVLHTHGCIETLESGKGMQVVCPGDWIITGVQGEHYPCKPDIFVATYEPLAVGAPDAQ